VIAEHRLTTAFRRMGIPDQFVEDVGDWTYCRAGIGLAIDDVVRNVQELTQGGA
jgi:hypothetical protein